MTELNPAAEAERLAKLAVAEGAQIGDILKTDAEDIKTDLTGDVEKVVAEVKPAKTVVQTNAGTVETDAKTEVAAFEANIKPAGTTAAAAISTAQAGVQAGVAAAKADVTTDTDKVATQAHGFVSAALADIEAIPSAISGELVEAKAKLGAALSWIEAHFTTQKKPVPVSPAAAATPPTPPPAS